MHIVHVARIGEATKVDRIPLPWATFSGYADTLYAALPRRFDTEHAATLVYSTPARVRKQAHHLVVRAHRYEAEALLVRGSIGAAKLVDRFRRLPIYLLHWSNGYQLDTLNGTALAADTATNLIEAVREAELLSFARQPGALLPTSSTFHYAAPNGKHYRSFLRVGTALQSQDALDSAAFWLLAHVQDDTIVILDSPTVLSVGLNLARYLADLSLADMSIRTIDALRGHPLDIRALANRLALVQPRVERRRHALIVSSVASSGSLLGQLAEVAESLQYQAIDSVALFADTDFATAGPSISLARLPGGLRQQPARGCNWCSGKEGGPSVPLRISPFTFHMEIAQAVTHTRITQAAADEAASFLHKYGDAGAVTAHRTEQGGHGRHHMLYVDGEALLSSSAFRGDFARKAASLHGKVSLIVHPEHAAAVALAKVAADTLGVTRIACDDDKLTTLSASDREKVCGSESLLIVDDVAITGDRLRSYRQFLMEAGRPGGSVHALVALARPNSSDALQGLRNLVDQMGEAETSFHAVETILLPDWDETKCPWCLEARWLDRYQRESSHPLQDVLERRRTLLTQMQTGLSQQLFWSWDGSPLVLGDGSIFAPSDATEAELFFAVASAIQKLRSQEKLDEEFVPPISKLLKHEFWARGRFYAPAITAAILRASNPHDLIPPLPRQSLLQAVATRLTERASHSVRTELLLASIQRKLPATATAENILSRRGSQQPIRDFLRAAGHYHTEIPSGIRSPVWEH